MRGAARSCPSVGRTSPAPATTFLDVSDSLFLYTKNVHTDNTLRARAGSDNLRPVHRQRLYLDAHDKKRNSDSNAERRLSDTILNRERSHSQADIELFPCMKMKKRTATGKVLEHQSGNPSPNNLTIDNNSTGKLYKNSEPPTNIFLEIPESYHHRGSRGSEPNYMLARRRENQSRTNSLMSSSTHSFCNNPVVVCAHMRLNGRKRSNSMHATSALSRMQLISQLAQERKVSKALAAETSKDKPGEHPASKKRRKSHQHTNVVIGTIDRLKDRFEKLLK